MRPWISLVLLSNLIAAAESPRDVLVPPSTPPAPQSPGVHTSTPADADGEDATHIAAHIIRQRALDLAGSGDSEVSLQLEALAHGLINGRVSLADAALVVQIANLPRPHVAALTPQMKAAAGHVESLLDGDASEPSQLGAVAPKSHSASPTTPSARGAHTPPGTSSAAPAPVADKVHTGKVYAVDNGAEGKAVACAVGLGSNSGVVVGSLFVIKRGDITVAKAKAYKVTESICYAEIVKDSLVDPRDDVRQDDQAVLLP